MCVIIYMRPSGSHINTVKPRVLVIKSENLRHAVMPGRAGFHNKNPKRKQERTKQSWENGREAQHKLNCSKIRCLKVLVMDSVKMEPKDALTR